MLIRNAYIRTMDEVNYPCGFIRIEGTLVSAVGSMEDCPALEDAEQVLDAAGMTALPGFVDAHTHLGMWEDGLGFEGDDGNEDSDPCTPHLRGLDGVNPRDRAFSEALDYGVTTIVTGPGSSNPIAGQLCALKTHGCRVDKMVVCAPLAIKMALGENPKNSYHEKEQGPVTRMGIAALIREQLSKAQRYMRQMDEAAEDEELEEPEFDARCEALLPLLRREIPVHLHAHRADDLFTGLRIMREFHLDCVLVHATEGWLVAEELACEGVPVIAGPMFGARTKPELVHAERGNPAVLERAGIPLAISTDHPELPARYLLLSAQEAVQSGMSEGGALLAITARAADICGIGARVGRIRVGLDADLLLFNGDPMQSPWAKPVYVFVEGCQVRGG